MLYLVILVQLKNETSMIAATGSPLHQPMSQAPLWRLQGRGKETETRAVPTSPRNAVQVDIVPRRAWFLFLADWRPLAG